MTAQPTVIIVDDDPGIREALEGLLRSVGLQVTALGSVPEFVKEGRPAGPARGARAEWCPARRQALLVFRKSVVRPRENQGAGSRLAAREEFGDLTTIVRRSR